MKESFIFKIIAVVLAVVAFIFPDSFGTSPELKWILVSLLFIMSLELRIFDVLHEKGEVKG